ncbi:uncharacterized protein [Phyllobates terribilis]|uniref:uncharacterized protein n=1 Tax=Phyllobates terribilis TaxID=111132 RepID=UPI003CCA70D9
MMETHWLRNGVRCLHGQGQPVTWRTTSVILLLALGIVMTTDTVDGHQMMSRIAGGLNADRGEWPWQVGLKFISSMVCGGALISPTWVVSAAHCVNYGNANDFSVILGVLNLTGASPTKVSVAVKQIIIHPIFEGAGTSGDMALLQLASPATYNSYIQPVTLPYQDQEFAKGKVCWLTGWGNTANNVKLAAPQTLQEVDLPLINYIDCNKMFQKAFNKSLPCNFVKKNMICAGYPEGKKDGCQLTALQLHREDRSRPSDCIPIHPHLKEDRSRPSDCIPVHPRHREVRKKTEVDPQTVHLSTLVTEQTDVDPQTIHLSTLVTETTEVDPQTVHPSTLVTEKTEVDPQTVHPSTLVTEKTEVDPHTVHPSTLVTEKTEVDPHTVHPSTLVTEKTEVDPQTVHPSTLVTEKTEVDPQTLHTSTLVTEKTEVDPQTVCSSKVTNRGTLATGKKLQKNLQKMKS